MKTALKRGEELPPHKMAFSAKTYVRLTMFLPQFEQNLKQHKISAMSRNKKSRDYGEVTRKARTYLIHFIRVMNMAIVRGELPPETRTWYGFGINDTTVPSLNSENELLARGKKVIDGEEMRIRRGGSPITNPTIAVVKVWFNSFVEKVKSQTGGINKAGNFENRLPELRKEADSIILDIWNEVEKTHNNLPAELRKEFNEKYGLVYFFRKEEIAKPGHGDKITNIVQPADISFALVNQSLNLNRSFITEIKE
jgi:hypothetical protein